MLTAPRSSRCAAGRAAQGRLRGDPRRRAVAAHRPHPALRARPPREPRARARAQAAPAPARDRPPRRARAAERGLTLVPTRIYFSGPHAKVEIALARGKDLHDKRETLRRARRRREIERGPARARAARPTWKVWPVAEDVLASMPIASTDDQADVDRADQQAVARRDAVVGGLLDRARLRSFQRRRARSPRAAR